VAVEGTTQKRWSLTPDGERSRSGGMSFGLMLICHDQLMLDSDIERSTPGYH